MKGRTRGDDDKRGSEPLQGTLPCKQFTCQTSVYEIMISSILLSHKVCIAGGGGGARESVVVKALC
jgi:hypothetical protein